MMGDKGPLDTAAATMGRKGGQARSAAKTRAASRNARKRWDTAKGVQAPVESPEAMEAQRVELLDMVLNPKPLVKRKETTP